MSQAHSQPVQQFLSTADGQHYSRFGNGPWVPIVQHTDKAGNRAAAVPSFDAPPFPTIVENGVHVPLTGPNDAPIMFQSVPGPSSIDPALVPLPTDQDDDFPPPHKVAASVARPASKVAGSRRPDTKGKGKQRAHDSETPVPRKKSTGIAAVGEKRKRGGRTSGATNYSNEDVEALLDIVEAELPIGGKGWNICAEQFNVWAQDNGRTKREMKSLENKFKQLVRTSKPTGDAECPIEIERAHQIESMMNDKAHTRELNDSDIDEAPNSEVEIISDDSDSDDAARPPKKAKSAKSKPVVVKTEVKSEFIARRSAAPDRARSHTSRPDAKNLLTSISTALDPAVQTARDDERAARTFQTTQYLALSNQLRDTQTQLSQLQVQLMDAERGRQQAERRADLMEMRLEMQAPPPRRRDRDEYTHHHSSFRSSHRHEQPSSSPPPSHHRRWRQEIYYPEGGRATYWTGSDDGRDLYRTPPSGTRVVSRDDSSPLPVPHSRPPVSKASAAGGSSTQIFQNRDVLVELDTPRRMQGDHSVSFTITPARKERSSSPMVE